MKLVGLCVLVSSVAAFAGDDVLIHENIEVGETVSRDVGIAIGVACDHPEVVDAAMFTRNQTNVLVLTGKQEGRTLCRAGTNPMAMSYLFDITVRPKGSKPRR